MIKGETGFVTFRCAPVRLGWLESVEGNGPAGLQGSPA